MPQTIPVKAGDKFACFTVVNLLPNERYPSGRKKEIFLVLCRCGSLSKIAKNQLLGKKTDSCFYCKYEKLSKHGMYKSPEYRAWVDMLQRCYNKNSAAYRFYGKIGVAVCDEWNPAAGGSFENFYNDVGPRPSNEYHLDKEAVYLENKTYRPGFVRWVHKNKSYTNKRYIIRVEWGGEIYTISELAKKYNKCKSVLYQKLRLNNNQVTADMLL